MTAFSIYMLVWLDRLTLNAAKSIRESADGQHDCGAVRHRETTVGRAESTRDGAKATRVGPANEGDQDCFA
jgi:hypothetical protein